MYFRWIFVISFLSCACARDIEIKTEPVFDATKSSLACGDVLVNQTQAQAAELCSLSFSEETTDTFKIMTVSIRLIEDDGLPSAEREISVGVTRVDGDEDFTDGTRACQSTDKNGRSTCCILYQSATTAQTIKFELVAPKVSVDSVDCAVTASDS